MLSSLSSVLWLFMIRVYSKTIGVACFSYEPMVRYKPIGNSTATQIFFTTPKQFLVSKITVSLFISLSPHAVCEFRYRKVFPAKKTTFRKGSEVAAQYESLLCNGLYSIKITPSSRYMDERGEHRPCYIDRSSPYDCPEANRKFYINERHQRNCTLTDWKRLQCCNPLPKLKNPIASINEAFISRSKAILEVLHSMQPVPRKVNVQIIAVVSVAAVISTAALIAIAIYWRRYKRANNDLC